MAQEPKVGAGKIRVNGQQLRVADEIRFMPSDEKREPLMGIDGNLAQQVTYQPVWIEAQLRYTRDVKWNDVFKAENATVTLELVDGSSWEMAEAFYAGDSEVEVKDGKVAARWVARKLSQVI